MPKRQRTLPIALTIAGSDSGSGAGLQADLKTFASLGVHGTCVVTCVTAQNPRTVAGMHSCTPAIVRKQIEVVFAELPPAAVKTGMLFSIEMIRVVAGFFRGPKRPPLIVDPVMVATSGARLLERRAVKALREELLPLAALVTPNAPEAEILAGCQIREPEDMRTAARVIQARTGCAVLVKGGHLKGLNSAVDLFYDGKTELLLSSAFVRGVTTHGTGCTYSAAITGYLALGFDLAQAVRSAKQYIAQAIAGSFSVGGHTVLNHFGEA